MVVSCSQFPQFLVSQEPVYDKLILADIRPTDGWILHVDQGTFPAYSGVQHTLDRFNHVWPNTTKVWKPTQAGNCLGTPCDKTEYSIGWGASRLQYYLEEQSWQTPLLCYDQDMHVTHAKEHFRQIISDILKPATSAIMSNFLRKRVAQFCDNKWIANKSFGSPANAFVYNWFTVGDEEIFIDTNAAPTNTYKLTPQMLQRRVEPLMNIGYFGKAPFSDMPPLIELVTSLDTCWELDHLGGQQGVGPTPTIAGNWRFTQWDAASKYWRYGFNGQIGNYATRVDPLQLRFNFAGLVGGKYRYRVVLPYKNVASSGAGGAAGIKSVDNPDYHTAQFCWSYIYHRKSLQALVADATPVNPEMPFSSRNFGGKWQFVMDNLGVDVNGCVVENKRRNKGQFIGDFKLAIRPQYTELSELIWHKREPQCVAEIDTCTLFDSSYPVQIYSSVNDVCDGGTTGVYPGVPNFVVTFTPTINSTTNLFMVGANSATCEGGPIAHQAATGATLAALVASLNAVLAAMGTWAVSGANITLTGPCKVATLPFSV